MANIKISELDPSAALDGTEVTPIVKAGVTVKATTQEIANLKKTAIPIAVSDELTALVSGVSKVSFRMPFGFTLTSARASVTTAPTGSVLTVDINKNGTSILSTKLTIDAGEKTSVTAATPAVISTASISDDDEITIDIDSVGSTVAGSGLKVYLIGVQL